MTAPLPTKEQRWPGAGGTLPAADIRRQHARGHPGSTGRRAGQPTVVGKVYRVLGRRRGSIMSPESPQFLRLPTTRRRMNRHVLPQFGGPSTSELIYKRFLSQVQIEIREFEFRVPDTGVWRRRSGNPPRCGPPDLRRHATSCSSVRTTWSHKRSRAAVLILAVHGVQMVPKRLPLAVDLPLRGGDALGCSRKFGLLRAILHCLLLKRRK